MDDTGKLFLEIVCLSGMVFWILAIIIRFIIKAVNEKRYKQLKAEVIKDDVMAAMDEVVDILERQMVRYKNRLNDKAKRSASFADELHAIALADDNYDDEEVKSSIVRTKHIPVKPMDPEEAVMEMEMLGHNFFVFINANTEDFSVVYKRKDGNYALIEPEE